MRCRILLCFFFFSSRRRHTRFDCDWSSDVCSSDLVFTETPTRDPGPPPTLGQHTDAVLRELGYTNAEIAALRARRVLGGPRRWRTRRSSTRRATATARLPPTHTPATTAFTRPRPPAP